MNLVVLHAPTCSSSTISVDEQPECKSELR